MLAIILLGVHSCICVLLNSRMLGRSEEAAVSDFLFGNLTLYVSVNFFNGYAWQITVEHI